MAQDWFAQFATSTPAASSHDAWFDEFDAGPKGMPPKAPTRTDRRNLAQDIRTGIAKGVGNTVVGLGELVHRIPGVSRTVDALYGDEGLSDRAFGAAREVVQPTNTGERIGFTGEQMGEFFLPGAGASRVGQVARAGAQSLVQSGDVATAGVSAGLTAVLPGAAGVAARAAGSLKKGAQDTVTKALGPTKEWAKAEAAKLAPEMLRRGVKGSRAAMLEQAKTASADVGKRIGAAYKAAAANGQTISGEIIRGELQLAKDAFLVRTAAGTRIPVAGTEGVVKQLDELESFVGQLGDDIPVDKAHAVKTMWDALVSKSGLYGQKATANATDNASAWAVREGASSFRRLLEDVPDIAALNKEYKFWTGLKNVLKETEKRTQAQGGGLIAAGTGGAGAIAGALSGDSMTDRAQNAMIGGLAGRQFVKLVQSPAWRTSVTAPMKDRLAAALASGKTGPILNAMSKITASLPSAAR